MVSVSGFYKWLKPTEKPKKDLETNEAILKVYHASRENYGRRRVYKALIDQGIKVGQNTVARRMKEMGLFGFGRPKFKVTTKRSKQQAAPYLLKGLKIKAKDMVWVSDITFIPTKEGWLYFCSILDAFSRKIVGWSMGKNLKAELVLRAVKQAISSRKPGSQLIFHSDRGSQYTSNSVRRILRKHGIRQSMTTIRGKCFENSQAESFFSLLKKELIHRCNFNTRQEAEGAIFEYVEVFYNRLRIHSSIGFVSPVEFEKMSN